MHTTTHPEPLHGPSNHPSMPVPVKVAVAHPEKVGKPDGVPHDIIGMLAYGIAVLAGATLLAWLVVGLWLAIIVGVVGGVVMMRSLPNRSGRERKVEARHNVAEHVAVQENPQVDHRHHAPGSDAAHPAPTVPATGYDTRHGL